MKAPPPYEAQSLRSVRYGFALALCSAVLLVLSPLLYRSRLVGLGVLLLIPMAVVLALVATILSAVGILASHRHRPSHGRAIAGLFVALSVLLFPVVLFHNARGTPPIHDVTTDTNDPPQFVDVVAIRRGTGALNSVAYEGARVASLQQRSFPDIRPLRMNAPPRVAFDRALAAAQSMHWQLVSADPFEGRVEATDTTALFGFKDDVVIRVRSDASGSRIDVRSESRVGGGDLGANAKRVRAYLARLSEAQ